MKRQGNRITVLDRGTLAGLRVEIEAILSPLAVKYGIGVHVGDCRFTSTTATFKLDVAVANEGGQVVTKEAEDFKRHALAFGLHPEDLGREFTSFSGERYIITGLKLSMRKYPVIGQRVDTGKSYKFPAHMVVQALAAGRSVR